MPFSTGAKNSMLDALAPDKISLHDGDPGSAGTDNEISGGSYARVAATFSAASNGERALASDVTFAGTALTAVSYIGIWDDTVFISSGALTGDAAFNASGEYTVKATTTKLDINDS